jgi:ABC-type oligopeptide transport system substrate-binding subunit
MISLSRTFSLFIARGVLGMLVLGVALLGLWTVSDLWGQAADKLGTPAQKKPRVEEEEDTPKVSPKKKPRVEEEEDTPRMPPKRKVIRVEEDEDPKQKPATATANAPAGDLKQLARQARHPAIRQLFRDLAVPHDHVVFKKSERVTSDHKVVQRVEDVEPVPVYLGSDPSRFRKRLTLHPLDNNGKPGKPFNPILESIQSLQPYERLAGEKVHAFLEEGFDRLPAQNDKHLSRSDMLTAAEQALSAVLRWHESARATGQREGEEWTPIESDLRKELLDEVLLKQMEALAEARAWEQVLALTRRLATTYTSQADRQRIARPVAELLKSALNDPTGSEERKQEARKRLLALEMEFPDNPVFRPISAGLQEQAQRLLDAAKSLGKGKDTLPRAMRLLRQAEETWPQLPGLRAYRIELSAEHPVLRVGVRGRLPRYLSPGWACTDTERRAVEMLFESLVKLGPDEAGIFRYRPGLAEYRPKVVPLGREFQLPRNATWSNNRPLDSGDIRYTVQLLKEGVGSGRPCAWGQLLDKVQVKGDPYRVTLRLNQGYLDPLALMTFKVLPRDQAVDTEKFAEQPVCSGPFLLDTKRHSDEKRRECMYFIANPSYGSRPGKREMPHIEEVRFYVYNDAVKELRQGEMDLVLDLTAKEADELRQQADSLQVTAPLPSAAVPNRRIYFLAVNQNRLKDAAVRRSLALAINREKLLNEHFRGPLKGQVHKALNGPFPAGSWACSPGLSNRQDRASLDLFDFEKARALSQQAPVRKAAESPLKLKYPEGDPVLAEALKALCDQVKEATGLMVELVPCDPCRLREDVEQTQSYDLAYYHYDFPDETYWLWPLLGPTGRAAADNNLLNFRDKNIQPLLQEAMAYRDFAQVQKRLRKVHEFLSSEMPLIPLWQLDPLLAYHHDVKPDLLDPVLVFTNIEEWRLQRK